MASSDDLPASSAEECLGLHIGGAQQANLGDGRGWVNETAVIRESLGNIPTWGTCLESLFGGNHFRLWTQESTGALFLACVTPSAYYPRFG